MPPLRKDFGNRLRAMRQERTLTQEQFAELVGISVDFLSLIERGRNAPSFETMEQMAGRLGVTVMVLFDFRKLPEPRESKQRNQRIKRTR